MRRPRLPAWLAVAALLTRAAPVLLSLAMHGHARIATEIDSPQYLELGSSLAWSGTFARGGALEIIRTPLYPLLLVPGLWLGWPVLVAVVAQIAGSVLVTALVFDTVLMLTARRRAAVWAAVVYLLEPCQPIVTVMVMPDALLTGLVTVLIWLAAQYQPGQPGSRGQAVLMAAIAAASAYAKPPGYFLGIVLVMALGIAWWRRSVHQTLARDLAVLLAVNFALMTAWNVRNYAATGYRGFATQIERAAFVSAPAVLESDRTGESFADVRARMMTRGGTQEAESIREVRRARATAVLRGLPRYAWLHVRGSLVTLMDPGIYMWTNIMEHATGSTHVGGSFVAGGIRQALHVLRAAPREALVLSCLFALWPLSCVLLWGVAIWTGPPAPGLSAVSVIVVMWLLIVGGPYTHCRYRAPVVPALAVLAAVGLSSMRPTPRG